MPQTKNTSKPTTMEELLASRDARSKPINLYRGQQIEGEIVAITDKEIILDLGTKSEGVLQKREASKDLKVGDKLKAFVYMVESENGQVVLSSSYQARPVNTGAKFSGHGINWPKFSQAQANKQKFQGTLVEVNKGGLIVEVDGARGFLPNSQVGFELLNKSSGGMDKLIGQTIAVTVIEIDKENNKLIFSQRGQVSDEIKKKLAAFEKGQKVKGKIVAILPFGLVVDVSGNEGLVFISDVSWEKIDDLQAKFKPGEELEMHVTGLDEELGRLNLSIKNIKEDPFAKIAEKYPTDEVVKGEVISASDTGILVKLDDPSGELGTGGIEGFLPASKMDPDYSYEVGKTVSLLVDGVDSRKRLINLAPMITSTEGLIYK